MAIATYQALCIDASDAAREAAFYAAALGLELQPHDDGPARLSGPSPAHTVWINEVPEPKAAKNRLHLDVQCASVPELEALGATVLTPANEHQHWTVMADPEGQEFCAFVRTEVPGYRLYELGLDCADHVATSQWWAAVLGVEAHADESGFSYIEPMPAAPFSAISFSPVPEPKTVKNRVHLDVDVASIESLVMAGARVLRPQDDEIRWTVMADIDGNEFCAFVPEP